MKESSVSSNISFHWQLPWSAAIHFPVVIGPSVLVPNLRLVLFKELEVSRATESNFRLARSWVPTGPITVPQVDVISKPLPLLSDMIIHFSQRYSREMGFVTVFSLYLLFTKMHCWKCHQLLQFSALKLLICFSFVSVYAIHFNPHLVVEPIVYVTNTQKPFILNWTA